jgi:hypothetical protein
MRFKSSFSVFLITWKRFVFFKFASYSFSKILTTTHCDTDNESNHIPGEDLVLLHATYVSCNRKDFCARSCLLLELFPFYKSRWMNSLQCVTCNTSTHIDLYSDKTRHCQVVIFKTIMILSCVTQSLALYWQDGTKALTSLHHWLSVY